MQEINFNFHGEEFQSGKNKKSKNLKQNILLLIFILFMFFLILEVVLRIEGYSIYGFGKGTFVYDNILGYKLSSNYLGIQSIYSRTVNVETNSQGMRDVREYNYNKTEGTFRIVVLGDSVSFGNGVELNESYVEILRKKFEGKNVEIINLGVPGYGISQEYLTFLDEGKKYNPDLVLIQFGLNDWGTDKLISENGTLSIDKSQELIANKDGFLVAYGKESLLRSVHLYLLWNLRSYDFFYTKLRAILSQAIANYWKSQNGVPSYFLNNNSLQYQEDYQGYYSLIEKMKNSTNANIVLFAGPFNSDRVSSKEIETTFNLNYSVDPEETKKSVEDITNKLNLSFIGIEEKEKNIFIPIDNHWNSEGNKLVADNLYSKLLSFVENNSMKR
jgi:hypothetical protein